MRDKLYITFLPTFVAADNEEDMIITGYFAAGDGVMNALTIDALTQGTYTSISDDGSSGTITLSINGGAYAAFSNPLILEVGDTLEVKRSIDTGDGYYRLQGTINNRILSFEIGAGTAAGDEILIDADSAGTYTSLVQDGSSGTITYSKNGGGFTSFASPLTLVAGDSIQIQRTTTTADGFIRLYGN